jgi:hypothetical protein
VTIVEKESTCLPTSKVIKMAAILQKVPPLTNFLEITLTLQPIEIETKFLVLYYGFQDQGMQ